MQGISTSPPIGSQISPSIPCSESATEVATCSRAAAAEPGHRRGAHRRRRARLRLAAALRARPARRAARSPPPPRPPPASRPPAAPSSSSRNSPGSPGSPAAPRRRPRWARRRSAPSPRSPPAWRWPAPASPSPAAPSSRGPASHSRRARPPVIPDGERTSPSSPSSMAARITASVCRMPRADLLPAAPALRRLRVHHHLAAASARSRAASPISDSMERCMGRGKR